jgi:hypothetical protein
MERMARTIALTLLTAILISGSSGQWKNRRLTGKVIAKVTGEALPATSIVVAGTSMGAAASLDG